MKLRQLTIHNIASIEDAVIHFDSAPLSDSEVFLITGKTGSGKSTILDAICLALYGITPRFKNSNMQGETRSDADTFDKATDVRQIMRRNTGEAFVALTFKGNNGNSYEATWSVARARKKVTGKLQPRQWRLKNLDTGCELTKIAEIEAEIDAAVGLKFEQFCRTTLLAQGEFTRFLNSEDKEKAEILEKILGVDIYAKIGAKIYEIATAKKQRYLDAKRLIDAMRILTDEELADRRRELADIDRQLKELSALHAADLAKSQWLSTDAKLSSTKAEAQRQLALAKAKMESAHYKEQAEQVKLWHLTIDARKWLSQIAADKLTIEQHDAALNALSGKFTDLLGGTVAAKNRIEALEKEAKVLDIILDTERDKARTYEQSGVIINILNNVAAGRQQYARFRQKLAENKEKLSSLLVPEHEEALHKLETARAEVEQGRRELERLKDEVAKLKLPELRSRIDKMKEMQHNLATASDRLLQLSQAIERADAERAYLIDLRGRIQQRCLVLENLTPRLAAAQQKYAQASADLERQRLTVDDFAKSIRASLHPGDVCPVCGKTVDSQLPHEDDLARLCAVQQEVFDKAKEELDKLSAEKATAETEISSLRQELSSKEAAFNADKSVPTARRQLREACEACAIDCNDEKQLAESISAAQKQAGIALKQLSEQYAQGEKLSNEVTSRGDRLEVLRRHADACADAERDKLKAADACRSEIAGWEVAIKQRSSDIDVSVNQLKSLISGSWPMDWQQAPADFAKYLKDAAKAYDEKMTQKEQTAEHIERLSTILRQAEVIINDRILATMPQWRDITPAEPLELENTIDAATEIIERLTSAISLKNDAAKRIAAAQQLLDAFLAQHPAISVPILEQINAITAQQIEQARTAIDNVHSEATSQQALLDAATRQYEEHRAQRPAMTDDDSLATLAERLERNREETDARNNRKGAIQHELNDDAEKRRLQGRQCEEAALLRDDYERWEQLNSLFGSSNGDKFRKIALSYVLADLIRSANTYMQSLTDRYTLKAHPGSYIISIEDAYQGYATRSAGTISGGESFLVSLALALALSDIGHRLAVDTLFIDEGFGTLSGEPLQCAIATLRSLHSATGRHVGIISHVEELRERIPVQIQVQQEGNSSSSRIEVVT